MTTVDLRGSLLEETFATLRACGEGRRECVVYWCTTLQQRDRVARVVHPDHVASAAGYEVDPAWVNRFFLDLRRDGETVRVQVHTHPGPAWHSSTDDNFALAPAPGFLSLVVPNFASGPVALTRSHLVTVDADGSWRPLDPEAVLVLV